MPASHRKMRRAADIHRLSTRTYNLRCPQGLGYDPGLGRSGDGMNELTKFDGGSADAQTAEALPHSVEAEQQLLGAILTNNDVYDRIASIIGSQHFYDPVHARIYDIAAARIAKGLQAAREHLARIDAEAERTRAGTTLPAGQR